MTKADFPLKLSSPSLRMDAYTTVPRDTSDMRKRGVRGRLVCLQSVEKLPSTRAHTQQEFNFVKQNLPHASSGNGIAYGTVWPYAAFELLKGMSNASSASIFPWCSPRYAIMGDV